MVAADLTGYLSEVWADAVCPYMTTRALSPFRDFVLLSLGFMAIDELTRKVP